MSKEVIFFAGAGASKEFGIPLLSEIGEKVEKILREKGEIFEFFQEIKEKLYDNNNDLEKILADLSIFKNEENIIKYMKFFINKLSSQKEIPKKNNTEEFLKHIIVEITEEIKRVIYNNCERANFKKASTFWKKFLNEMENIFTNIKPYTIFTTNYDLILENYCRHNNIECITGFGKSWIGKWDPEKFNQATTNSLLLYKLHGSLNWYYDKKDKIVKSEERIGGKDIEGRILPNWLLFPGGYQDWTKEPFIELLYQFRKELKEVKYLIVIGYSFRDPFIQDVLIHGFRKNMKLKMILIDPNAKELIKDKLSEIKDRVIPCQCEFGKEEKLNELINKVKKHFPKILYFEPVGTNFDEITKKEDWIIVRTEVELRNNINKCDVMVLFIHEELSSHALDEDLQREIVKYVKNGGKLIVFHDALYFSYNQILLKELCGEVGEYTITTEKTNGMEIIAKEDHPITQGISNFKIKIKEDVWIKIIPPSESKILFVNSKNKPLGWLRKYGKGEVFSFILGHCKELIENKNIQRIILNVVKYFLEKEK